MLIWRRFLSLFTCLALCLALVTALAPLASRLAVAADPVRAAMLTEVCMAVDPADPASGTAVGMDLDATVHCPFCLAPAAFPAWPPRSAEADFDRPVARLRPVTEPLLAPRAMPPWRRIPSRAPPVLA